MKASKIPGNFNFLEFQWGGRELNTILTFGFSITSCGTRELRLYDARFQVSTHAQRWRGAQAGGSQGEAVAVADRASLSCCTQHSLPFTPTLYPHHSYILYHLGYECICLRHHQPMYEVHPHVPWSNQTLQCKILRLQMMFPYFPFTVHSHLSRIFQTCLRTLEARIHLPVGLYGTSHSILWPLRLLEEDLDASGLKPSWVVCEICIP